MGPPLRKADNISLFESVGKPSFEALFFISTFKYLQISRDRIRLKINGIKGFSKIDLASLTATQ